MERDAEPKLLCSRDDVAQVDHRTILIAAGSFPEVKPQAEGHLHSTVLDGIWLRSGAYEHDAQLRLELWSAAPARDESRAWEAYEEGRLVTTNAQVFYGGPLTMASNEAFDLLATGTFGIRVYCDGRSAVHDFEEAFYASDEDDDTYLEIPPGIEKWLVQLWLEEVSSTP